MTVPEVIILLILLLISVVYFMPTWVALHRNHRNTKALFTLNLFLGLTGVGWVAALVWALVNHERRS